MYELIKITDKTYYIDCPAKIGIYRFSEKGVYLIDSGSDKEAGRRVRKILDEQGWQLAAIINTHSNADHIGGNRYLQQQTGCKIFAKGIEAAFTRFPVLEPSFLYGGFPCKELRHKFLMAEKSEAEDISHPDFPRELEVIPLPGHFFDMIGVRTPDNVVFLADCISSPTTIQKYKITFIYDVAEYLKTLDNIEKLQGDFFVPAHAEASADIKKIVNINREAVTEISGFILKKLAAPQTYEELLKTAFDEYGLTMNFEQYVLVGSTLRSYLSYLSDSGELTAEFSENRLLWRKK
ncbi:MAG: MBL fold metallo-hydrolase [Oscillospiraceae bacterium]|nr:MBL fold metallo-hydrolase [Oscillospiraceae bacterium]